MDWTANAIPLAALIIAAATLILTGYSLRHKASGERVEGLAEQIKELEKSLAECEAREKRYQTENLELMRRVLAQPDLAEVERLRGRVAQLEETQKAS